MSWILLYLRTPTPTILWPTAFCCIFPFIFYWKVLMVVLKYWDQHNAVFISFWQCCQSYSALHLESNKYIIVTWKTKQKKKNKMKKDGERYMTAFLFLSLISVSSSRLYLVFWFEFMVIRSTATAINRSHSQIDLPSMQRFLSSFQLRVLILQLHQGFKGHKFVSPWISKAIF